MPTVLDRVTKHSRNNVETLLNEVFCGWEGSCLEYDHGSNLPTCDYPAFVNCRKRAVFEEGLKEHLREDLLDEIVCGWEKPCSQYKLNDGREHCSYKDLINCPQRVRFESNLKGYILDR